MTNNSQIRVRFAPAPSGHLHIGGLRTALFNYLFARHNKGIYLLRIEDTDVGRSTDEYKQSILRSFAWVDILPDEPVVIQSERVDLHKQMANQLVDEKKAYRCYCTHEQLVQRLGKDPHNEQFVAYDRYCLENPHNYDKNRPHVIRFKMPDHDEQVYAFNDIIRDRVEFSPDQFDDFIIVRGDGLPVYNFVVVIDDAFMKITHVIRGEEHIPNTPKQIALYKAFNYTIPAFAHLPMILGPDGHKLSKRDGAKSVYEYMHEGYLPDALVNYLVRLGWSHGDQEIFNRQELIQFFSLEHVGKKNSIFDIDKMNWVNSMYIRALEPHQIREYMIAYCDPNLYANVPLWSVEQIDLAIAAFKERVHTLQELLQALLIVYHGPQVYDAQAIAKWVDAAGLARLMLFLKHIQEHGITNDCLKIVAATADVKLVQVAQPVRIALFGKDEGPGVTDLLRILPQDTVINRLKKLVDNLQ